MLKYSIKPIFCWSRTYGQTVSSPLKLFVPFFFLFRWAGWNNFSPIWEYSAFLRINLVIEEEVDSAGCPKKKYMQIHYYRIKPEDEVHSSFPCFRFLEESQWSRYLARIESGVFLNAWLLKANGGNRCPKCTMLEVTKKDWCRLTVMLSLRMRAERVIIAQKDSVGCDVTSHGYSWVWLVDRLW